METISRSIPVKRPYKLPIESNEYGSLYSDANGTQINITYNSAPSYNNKVTAMCWLKRYRMNRREDIFSAVSLHSDYWFIITDSNIMGVYITGVDSNYRNTTIIPVIGVWTHVAFTWDGTNVITYRNGMKIDTLNGPGNMADGIVGNFIFRNTDVNVYANVELYDVISINDVLTANQIWDLAYGRTIPTQHLCALWYDFRLGHARDLSGYGNHGTVNGNVRFV